MRYRFGDPLRGSRKWAVLRMGETPQGIKQGSRFSVISVSFMGQEGGQKYPESLPFLYNTRRNNLVKTIALWFDSSGS
jgi:hypothetical protein